MFSLTHSFYYYSERSLFRLTDNGTWQEALCFSREPQLASPVADSGCKIATYTAAITEVVCLGSDDLKEARPLQAGFEFSSSLFKTGDHMKETEPSLP